MDPDFADCLVLNTVMAARALLRRYDERLKPFGVSVVQFTILKTVNDNAGSPVAHMAQRIAMERTTLVRNLDLLERKGLVQSVRAKKGNGRHFSLTDAGEALLQRLLPEWRKAQTEMRANMSDTDPSEFLTSLRQLQAG